MASIGGLAENEGAVGQSYVMEKGRASGTEHMVAYDENGNEIARLTSGLKGFVRFTPEFTALIKDPNNNIVAHHNHPKSLSLSGTDVAVLAARGLRAVWAHGHDGSIYRAELTPEFDAVLSQNPNEGFVRLKAISDRIEQRFLPLVQDAVDKGLVPSDDINRAFDHIINQVLHGAGLINYETNFSAGDLIARVPDLYASVQGATLTAQKEAFSGRPPAVRSPVGYMGFRRSTGEARHPGDMGTVFDRAQLAAVVRGKDLGGGAGQADHRGQKAPPELDGDQYKLLEEEAVFGLAQPTNRFKRENSYDTSIGDILRTRLLGRFGKLNVTEAQTQLQDKFKRVELAEKSVGLKRAETYQAESLYYGRTGNRLEQLGEHHIDPLIRDMKGRGVSLDMLDEYLYARHATERNNKIGAMYPAGHDFHEAMNDPDIVGGSGMSKNEAIKVLQDIQRKGKLADVRALAGRVDALTLKTRQTLLASGLIDRDTFDAWTSAYKYYVPLRGSAEGTEDHAFMAGQGSGMNVRGKEAKTAFGRRSEAASPLAYTIMQAELAIVRAEKNKVGNTFVRFARNNPDPKRWIVNRPTVVKSIDKNTGLVTSFNSYLPMQADNVFSTKVDGKTVNVELKGPDGLNIARALKNMGSANVHSLVRMMATLTHTMAKLATSWNADFMVPNFTRDIGEAFINLQAEKQKQFITNFFKHLLPAVRGSMGAIAGKTGRPGSRNATYIEAFKRFDAAGGRIHFFGIEDPDRIESSVEARLKRLSGGAVNTLKDIGDKAAKGLEIAGGGIENATRLAAFMAAEDVGMSTAEAAMLSRGLTVDFNKKGELGSVMSALYMFSNAGAQGVARTVRTLGHKRAQIAVGGLAAAGALATLLALGMGGDDSAGVSNYMKLPKWERDKNIVFMLPGDYYAKIPLPYGFSPFAVFGSHAVTALAGKESASDAAGAVLNSVLDAFNPLGEESSPVVDIVPSAARPAFHIWGNQDWTGRPLYPTGEQAKGKPKSTQFFGSTSEFSKVTAKLLNQWSGGSSYEPGFIDVHPGSIDHVMQTMTGGVGRFAKGIADSIINGFHGEWQIEKTPIIRRFVGRVGPEADAAAYYALRGPQRDYEGAAAQAKKDIKAGVNEAEAEAFLAKGDQGQREVFKRAEKELKGLRKEEAEVMATDVAPDTKREIVKSIRERMRAVQNEARGEVLAIKRNAAQPGASP